MAVYANIDAMRTAIQGMRTCTRENLLFLCKHAQLTSHAPFAHATGVKAMVFAQEVGLITKDKSCHCGEAYSLCQRTYQTRGQHDGTIVAWKWCGPKEGACETCYHHLQSATRSTVFSGCTADKFLDVLDVVVMWCLEYPMHIIKTELSHLHHHTVETWISWCQYEARVYLNKHLSFADMRSFHFPTGPRGKWKVESVIP